MKPIQFVLLLGLGCSFAAYFAYLRSIGRDRFLSLLLFIFPCVAVLSPASTTVVANWLGVGRGTDLVFYLFNVFALFALIVLHLKIRRLESALTVLTRELALQSATTQPPNPR